MGKFKAKIWEVVGSRCGYIKENEHAKYFV